MSTGLVVCSTCSREIHQDGPGSTWLHCEDKSPRCVGASARHPQSIDEIVGKWCGADAELVRTAPPPRQILITGTGIAAMAALASSLPSNRLEVKPAPRVRPHVLRDPQAIHDENVKRTIDWQRRNQPHEHKGEMARRRKARERREAKAGRA